MILIINSNSMKVPQLIIIIIPVYNDDGDHINNIKDDDNGWIYMKGKENNFYFSIIIIVF